MRNIIIIIGAFILVSVLGCSNPKSKDLEEEPSKASIPAVNADTMPKPSNVVHSLKNIRPLPGRYYVLFGDSNATQLTAAKALGISPISDLRSAYNLRATIRKIYTCDAFVVDSLYHSMPYLVPKAADLLHDIGVAFTDSVIAKGGKRYKVKVTSIMRTESTLSELRRSNRNASTQSCHRYGTTFDVSYSKFICCDSSYVVSLYDLKCVLAEILYKMKQQGRCYVKYEVKQGCFHVTVR
jgi:hypothetical protein